LQQRGLAGAGFAADYADAGLGIGGECEEGRELGASDKALVELAIGEAEREQAFDR
jgi:hypothetical protein